MIERLEKLQAEKKRFSNGSDLDNQLKTNKALQREIEVLSKAFLNKSVSGCSNCYMDAYIELVNLNIKKAMAKVNSKFKLRAGALLRSSDGDISKNVSQANLDDDKAIYHLKANPKAIKYFEKLPTQEELDEIFGEGYFEIQPEQIETIVDEANETIESLQNRITELEKELSDLQPKEVKKVK